MSGAVDHIERHYAQSDLFEKIIEKLAQSGIEEAQITAQILKPIDEFHIGGIAATKALLDPLGLTADTRLLDIGSGIGGTARFIASEYGIKVVGIDLTPDFVICAEKLSEIVDAKTSFEVGSGTQLPFADASFDAATLIHVGMNIQDKDKLFAEAARVLTDGGVFAVYDVMLFGGQPEFPVPWATTAEDSFLGTPADYQTAAQKAGFTLEIRNDRGAFAKQFFADMQAKIAASGPPPVSLPMLMGDAAPNKMANMIGAVQADHIQPVEMIFRKG